MISYHRPSPISLPPPPLCTSHGTLCHDFLLLPVLHTIEDNVLLLNVWQTDLQITSKYKTHLQQKTEIAFITNWTVSVILAISQMLLLVIDLLWFPENSRGFHKFNNASSSVSGLKICSCGHT